jgi:hypothetical protein
MKIIIALIFSFGTLANFTGKWTNSGYYESDSSSGECKEVFMQFKKTDEAFMILDGGYICGEIQASYPPSKFKIIGEKLFYNGEKVGIINSELIMISYLNNVYNLSLEIVDDQIFFYEQWKEEDDFLFIRAKLNKL